MPKNLILFTTFLVLAGCAKHADEIPTSYVPSVMYDSYTCKQLQMEAIRVSRRTSDLQYRIEDNAEGDDGAMALGLILFWPALFFIDGDKPETYEYARAKGEMDAIETASVQKECGFKVVRPPVPKRKADDSSQQDPMQPVTSTTGTKPSPFAGRLKQLDALLKQEIISKQEYEERRKAILKEL